MYLWGGRWSPCLTPPPSWSYLCPSFLRLNHISLSVYTTFCLSIHLLDLSCMGFSVFPGLNWLLIVNLEHLLMDTWVASTSCLLWIVLLWTLVCKYLFETLFSILLATYAQVGIVGSYGSSIFNVFRTSRLFSIEASPFYIPTNSTQTFQFFHNHANSCYFLECVCVCVCVTILLGVRCGALTLEHGVLHTWLRLWSPSARIETHTWQLELLLHFPHDQRSQVILADLLKSLFWALQLHLRESLRNCYGSVNFPGWAVFSVGVG